MRKLTQREKTLLGAVAIVAVIALFMTIEPTIRQGFSGGELAVKREQLQTAQEFVQLSRITEQIGGKIRPRQSLLRNEGA